MAFFVPTAAGNSSARYSHQSTGHDLPNPATIESLMRFEFSGYSQPGGPQGPYQLAPLQGVRTVAYPRFRLGGLD